MSEDRATGFATGWLVLALLAAAIVVGSAVLAWYLRRKHTRAAADSGARAFAPTLAAGPGYAERRKAEVGESRSAARAQLPESATATVSDAGSGRFGQYVLVRLLGQGGMGHVFEAVDTAHANRRVALKVLSPQLAQDPVFQERFRREARTAASINEPHVVPIHNYGEIDGKLYVDMRLISGRDLASVLEESRTGLEPTRAVNVVEQAAFALDAAHVVGLVHRDVKPSNILLAERDFAYLIDFGIARALGQTGLTSVGSTVGTLAYMAPERFTSDRVDHCADVYSLACVLYECLTGEPPFSGDTVERLLAAHLTAPPPTPSAKRPGVVAAGFDDVVAKGMAKDPDARYRSTLELAAAARAALV